MKKINLPELHRKLTYTAIACVLGAGVLTVLAMVLEKLITGSPAAWLSIVPFLISLATAVATATGAASIVISLYRFSDK